MGRIIRWGLSAILGIGAGLLIYSSLMLVQVEGSSMLPTLEPGARILVNRLDDGYDVKVGDLVIYEAPYYSIDGEGKYLVKRVTGSRGRWLKVDCDADTAESRITFVDKEKIIGKAIFNLSQMTWI